MELSPHSEDCVSWLDCGVIVWGVGGPCGFLYWKVDWARGLSSCVSWQSDCAYYLGLDFGSFEVVVGSSDLPYSAIVGVNQMSLKNGLPKISFLWVAYWWSVINPEVNISSNFANLDFISDSSDTIRTTNFM